MGSYRLFFAALAGLLAVPLEAQEVASDAASSIPDPATIVVPQITGGRDVRVVRDGWKYFYFWRADTSFEQAYADFADCYRFLPVSGADVMVPTFVAWQGPEALASVKPNYNPQYGLMGAAIAALVAGPIERRASQSRMRRCMEPRGYLRFPMTEEAWKQAIDGYSRASIGIGARLASGPRPDADPLPGDR